MNGTGKAQLAYFILCMHLFALGSLSKEIPPDLSDSWGGLTFKLEEKRLDESYTVYSDRVTQVDFRSTLFLQFDPSPTSQPTEPNSPKWQAVEELAKVLEKSSHEYVSLSREVVRISDPNALSKFQERVRKHGETPVTAVLVAQDLAENLGLSKRDFKARMLYGVDRSDPNSVGLRVYRNLGEFLKEQIETLQARAREFAEERGGFEVTVVAIHQPKGEKARAIHVEPYDNLPSGELQPPGPLEEYGIRMTPADLRRFRMEMKMNERVAGVIREVVHNGTTVRATFEELGENITEKLDQILERSRGQDFGPENWQKKLTAVIERLRKIDDLSEETQASSKALRETLEAIQGDVNDVVSIVSDVNTLRDQLREGRSQDLFELIAGEGGMLQTAGRLVQKARDLANPQKWQRYLDAIRKHAPPVVEYLAEQAVITEIEALIESMKDDLPELAGLLSDVLPYLSSGAGIIGAAEILDDVAHQQIYHDVEAPPTATIDLNSYDLGRRDIILVKVQFRPKSPAETAQLAHVTAYRLEVEKLDLYSSLAASLIFARAATGDEQATRWSSNVAGMVNWHYRIREPDKPSEKVWNWLSPGAGVHLASLNQGDDTVEFGIGANLTFWGGLMHVGYGFNLSQPDDREYYFVGINLFHLLDAARGAVSSPGWEREIDVRQ